MTSSTSSATFWIRTGAITAALAVVFGAFAAHGLDGFLIKKYAGVSKTITGQTVPGAVKYLADFKTAAEYQMSHGLALLTVGLLSLYRRSRALQFAGWSFLIGVLLFSGSLYLLVLTGITRLGAITPLGGTAFILGWIALAVAGAGASRQTADPLNPGP